VAIALAPVPATTQALAASQTFTRINTSSPVCRSRKVSTVVCVFIPFESLCLIGNFILVRSAGMQRLRRLAERSDVGVQPLSYYYKNANGRHGLVLGYGATGLEDIEEGLKRLGSILKTVMVSTADGTHAFFRLADSLQCRSPLGL
jgi:hypothetical protein